MSTKVRTFTAARLHGYNVRYVSGLKNRGVLRDAGWGYVYLEDVAAFRAAHPDTPPYGRPDQMNKAA